YRGGRPPPTRTKPFCLGRIVAPPRTVSRRGIDRYHGYAWNALVDLCAVEPLESLTTVQRTAALAFWYMSEVSNGGHFQYFVNRHAFAHAEVVGALRSLGAEHSATVLASALKRLDGRRLERPRDVEKYLQDEARFEF